MGIKPLRYARHFMMSFQMTLMMGEDDDNVDDSGNENAIDADNDNMN